MPLRTSSPLRFTRKGDLADYQDDWIEDYWGWGTWGIDDEWYYGFGNNGYGWEAADWNLSASEDSLSISKFKYKFTANPSAPTTILVSARQIRQLIDSHEDYDFRITPALLQYRIQVDAYIAHFLPADTIRTVALIRDTYKIMATTDANWMGSE